ncbi:MAG: B12-binding domain-containing radical SAM protein [Candidatus Omnitrophica bacterium]|nr:B12-binding domain-containing radical SAM protein [Candidatus Omnitrophota bacterium]
MKSKIKNPKFLLVYPPQQFEKKEIIRPEGTLSLPYLAASLAEAGFHSQILDACVGTAKDKLEEVFYREKPISDDLVRVGMPEERIVEEIRDFDVIAVTSIFTQQTSRCLEIGELVKKFYPEKLLIAGGVNARNLKDHFFSRGYDVIFTSEGEKPIVEFAKFLHSGAPTIAEIDGIAYKKGDKVIINPAKIISTPLDDIAMPLWEKLPNERYWKIGRIWGGRQGWIGSDDYVRYAAIITSRGCPYNCKFCHISKEKEGECGNIGRFRVHSLNRVEQEFDKLKSLNVNTIFVNDDCLLADKKRIFLILELLKKYKFSLADVNGVNITHFFKRIKGKFVIDDELIEALYEAGFRKVSLPFESGSQRILDKYCSGKWNIEKVDTAALVKRLDKVGIAADGNFMIGWPDESPEELTSTFVYAKRMMNAGMVGCGFFIVQPFPGTILFEEAIKNGQLSKSWHWDDLGWAKGSPFNNIKIDKKVLRYTWGLALKLLNESGRVKEFIQQQTRIKLKERKE